MKRNQKKAIICIFTLKIAALILTGEVTVSAAQGDAAWIITKFQGDIEVSVYGKSINPFIGEKLPGAALISMAQNAVIELRFPDGKIFTYKGLINRLAMDFVPHGNPAGFIKNMLALIGGYREEETIGAVRGVHGSVKQKKIEEYRFFRTEIETLLAEGYYRDMTLTEDEKKNLDATLSLADAEDLDSTAKTLLLASILNEFHQNKTAVMMIIDHHGRAEKRGDIRTLHMCGQFIRNNYFSARSSRRLLEAQGLRLAVYPFSGTKADAARTAANEIIIGLSQYSFITLIDRAEIETLFKEQSLQASGATEEANSLRLGRMLNARLVLTGSVGEQLISARVIDAETGAHIAGAQTALNTGAGKLSRDLASELEVFSLREQIRTLRNDSPDIYVEVKMVVSKTKDFRNQRTIYAGSSGECISFGDFLYFEIKSDKKGYFTVIDIQPDGHLLSSTRVVLLLQVN